MIMSFGNEMKTFAATNCVTRLSALPPKNSTAKTLRQAQGRVSLGRRSSTSACVGHFVVGRQLSIRSNHTESGGSRTASGRKSSIFGFSVYLLLCLNFSLRLFFHLIFRNTRKQATVRPPVFIPTAPLLFQDCARLAWCRCEWYSNLSDQIMRPHVQGQLLRPPNFY